MIRHFILLLTSFILAMFVQAPLCFATLGQKVGVSLASSSYNKTTETAKNSRSGSSSVGIASEYSLFLRNDLGVFGQIEMNLGGGGGILFLGGAGGVKWYISGGENTQYRDSHLSIRTNSKLNTFAVIGLGGKSFDFTVEAGEETEESEATAPGPTPGGDATVDTKNVLIGSVIGLVAGLGFEYPVLFDILVCGRVEFFQGFSAPTTPDITTTSIWLGAGFPL